MVSLASTSPIFIFFVFLILFLGSAAFAGLRAAPWLPTRQRDVERMFQLSNVQPGELVMDLGAGDGRFLLHAVKQYQARAEGFEISLLPYLASLWRLRGLARSQAKMHFRDFFHQKLDQADLIACFLTPKAMAKLEKKWLAEAKPGSRLVSYAFPFPNISPKKADKPDPKSGTVYLYIR
ncbi:MAG: class I SAM-dependent methyltransferase [Candidatus Nomurabacteria bacterium]|nr:MAG: class I SAM-dependent methyltransferase [Candidatus Nomurabacteria bacterium]